jgi:hypothetical protein
LYRYIDLESMALFRKYYYLLILLLVLNFSKLGLAQTIQPTDWNGEWIGEGTLFKIGISVDNNVIKVVQIESLGFVWTSLDGEVDGSIVRVNVEYAGVKGIIQAKLINPTTAIAFAATCEPGFMVVCALAKDRQAVFKKVE